MPFTPDQQLASPPAKKKSAFVPDSAAPVTQAAPVQQPEAGPVKKTFSAVGNFFKGAAKGAASTVSNVGTMGQNALDRVAKPITEAVTGKPFQKNMTLNQAFDGTSIIKPTNTAQKVGFATEQIGEFFLPQTGVSKGVKIVEGSANALPKLLQGATKLAGRVGLEAASTAGVSKAQGASEEEVRNNAIMGGAVPIVGSVLNKAGKVLNAASKKIEFSQIKPTAKDISDGFKVDNVFKYNLGGSLQETAEKTHSRITGLADQLKQAIGASNAKLNLSTILDDVQKDLGGAKSATFGQNTKLQNAINFLREEIGVVAKDGVVDLADAQQVKRSVGKLGAWQFGVKDPDATALETVANKMYTKLRLAIEKAAPDDVAAINKELSDLIPIENALIRRIPVAERNNMLSLTDVIAGVGTISNPANMWLLGLNKLAKSTRVANVLNKVSKPSDNRGAVKTVIFGSGKPQPPVKLKIPNIPVGLSIKDVSKKPNIARPADLKTFTPSKKKPVKVNRYTKDARYPTYVQQP